MKRILVIAAIALCAPAAACAQDRWQEQIAALNLAVNKGDPEAMTRLAQKYEHAEGVAKDLQKANQFYCRAAKSGYAEAQFKLGWVYANGRGVARDDAIAAALFALAAEQGHEHAIKLLRYVRQQGEGQLPSCLQPEHPLQAAGIDGPAAQALLLQHGQAVMVSLPESVEPSGVKHPPVPAQSDGGVALRLDTCRSCPVSQSRR